MSGGACTPTPLRPSVPSCTRPPGRVGGVGKQVIAYALVLLPSRRSSTTSVLAHRLGEKVFNVKLESGVLVLKFTCVGVSALGPAPPPGAGGEPALVPAGHGPAAEGLHNVPLQYGRPWRPTFARMRWEPLEDRPGVAGVAPEVVGEGDGGAVLA
eukprot:1120178-Pyramimonas_sp.AAC.1